MQAHELRTMLGGAHALREPVVVQPSGQARERQRGALIGTSAAATGAEVSTHITNAVLAMTALLVGCGGMMTGTSEMRGAIGEDQQHLTGARAASSMPEMLGEADRHASRMTLIVEDMGDHMATMQHCADIGSMMDLRDGMRVELDAHLGTMHAETQMSSARGEVPRHPNRFGWSF